MGRQFLIDERFANAVMQYLTSKPFIEVHEFIIGFQNLKPFIEEPKEMEIEKPNVKK